MVEWFDCEQGSAEWFEARRGIPTASEFGTVLAKGEGKSRRTYLYKLAGEIITGELTEGFTTPHMERGKVMEADARRIYEFMLDAECQLAGFVRNGAKGCSPDSTIGETGLVEIKTKLPHLMIDVLTRGEIPSDHVAQCQGALWVCEREWIDFVAFWPRMPLFVKRAYRDEAYIANLAAEVDRFNDELAETVERIRNYTLQVAA